MTIPWYFLWSENYRIFYEILKDTMKEPELELCPIEIPQERFDAELYKYDGDNTKHFWHGSYIKVDAVIDCLEKATSDYILFSDIDIVVKPGVHGVCKKYMDEGYDMVYLREADFCNIGFMLLRNNGKALAFWKSIKASMEAEMDLDRAISPSGGEIGSHDAPAFGGCGDQKYVNKLLPQFYGKWGQFETSDMICMNEWDGESPYKLMQILCSCLGKEYNMAEKIFYIAQHIELNDYMRFVKPEIIPYIESFQEILMRQWANEKEALAATAAAADSQ